MTIHALEHEDPLDVEHVRQYPTAHPRCGTEFLVVFIILSILLFSLLAGQSLLVSIVGRILLIPVIASIAYEILRFGAKPPATVVDPLAVPARHLAAGASRPCRPTIR